MYDSCLAAKYVARASWRSALAWLRPLEVWNFRIVPAAGVAAPVVDGSCAAGAAAVGTVATATDERSRRVELSGALSVLTADSKSVMSSETQSLVSSFIISRLQSSQTSLSSSSSFHPPAPVALEIETGSFSVKATLRVLVTWPVSRK